MVATVINPELKKYEGKTLAEIGKAEGRDPIDAMMDIIAADKANTYCIQFIMSEQDVRDALKSPLVAFCTDSGAQAEDGILREKSHPRGWASTARILGHYVRDEHVLALEDAVAKMTSRSAARAHLFDRGVLRAGMAADVVVFDLARVKANSTYLDPIHYCSGYRDVAVNGVLVVADGLMTGARPGQVLRGPGWRNAAARAGFSRPGSANAARERRDGPGRTPGRTARRAR